MGTEGGRGGAGLTLFPFGSVWMPPPRIVPVLAGACPREVDCGLRTQGAENSPLRPSPVSGGLKGPVVTWTWFQPFNCGPQRWVEGEGPKGLCFRVTPSPLSCLASSWYLIKQVFFKPDSGACVVFPFAGSRRWAFWDSLSPLPMWVLSLLLRELSQWAGESADLQAVLATPLSPKAGGGGCPLQLALQTRGTHTSGI